jgi:hypothetical protein
MCINLKQGEFSATQVIGLCSLRWLFNEWKSIPFKDHWDRPTGLYHYVDLGQCTVRPFKTIC